ncbi:hypothetical protein [Bacteroides sp.]|nr:hypothetical protein [Bacteroides sp.]
MVDPLTDLEIDVQSFDIPRLVTVYPDKAVYHHAIEQTKEQLLQQMNLT